MFLLILVLCGICLFIGMRIGWKWGFKAHERIDDKIIGDLSKSKASQYNRHDYFHIDK